MTIHVRRNRWTTIATKIGGASDLRLYWLVETGRRCSWRRIGLVPWWGRFTKRNSAYMFLSTIQIKSPVDTKAVSSFRSQDISQFPGF